MQLDASCLFRCFINDLYLMNKRNHFFLGCIVLCCSMFAKAQPSLLNAIETPLQVEMKQGLSDVLYLVRVEYVLEDRSSGQQFGRANKPYFNRSYAAAVAIDGHLQLHHSMLKPWENDVEFGRYREDSTKMPVLKGWALRPFHEPAFEELHGIAVQQEGDRVLLQLPGELPSLSETTYEDHAKGCALYIKTKERLIDLEETELELHLMWGKLFRQNPISDRHWVPDKLMAEDNLLGAVFVIPQGRNGRMEFVSVGLLFDQDGWKVLPSIVGETEAEDAPAIHTPTEHVEPPGNPEELNPIPTPLPGGSAEEEDNKSSRKKKAKD